MRDRAAGEIRAQVVGPPVPALRIEVQNLLARLGGDRESNGNPKPPPDLAVSADRSDFRDGRRRVGQSEQAIDDVPDADAASLRTILMTLIVTYGSKLELSCIRELEMRFAVIAAAMLLFVPGMGASAQTASAPPVPSIWKNQSGSILELESIDAQGVIRGSFTNHKQGTDCLGTAFPVEGQMLSNGLFFATTFPPCFTVTTWQGSFSGNTIQTNYTYDYVDGKTGNMTPVTGSDTFTKLP